MFNCIKKLIRTDKPISCYKCGRHKSLVSCTVQDEYSIGGIVRSEPYETIYCNKCLNEFQEDEENYGVFE